MGRDKYAIMSDIADIFEDFLDRGDADKLTELMLELIEDRISEHTRDYEHTSRERY